MLPEAVPSTLSSFYYFMLDKGFPIISGAYEKDDEGFVCAVFFEPTVDMQELWKFLNLPKLMTKTPDRILASDGSWEIVKDSGVVMMSFGEEHHIGVLCYIMANR